MIGIFILVQLLFTALFLLVDLQKVALLPVGILIFFLVWIFSNSSQTSSLSFSFPRISIKKTLFRLPQPKNLLIVSSWLFYIGIILFIWGVSSTFSATLQLIFGSIILILSIVIACLYFFFPKTRKNLIVFMAIHSLLAALLYVISMITRQPLEQYLVLHGTNIIFIAFFLILSTRNYAQDIKKVTLFFWTAYILFVMSVMGIFTLYTDWIQGLYIIYICIGLAWVAGTELIPISKTQLRQYNIITLIHISAILIMLFVGMKYPGWSVFITIFSLIIFGGTLIFENFQRKNTYVFVVLICFLIGVYNYFFYQIIDDISYIGYVITAVFLPISLVLSTYMYTKQINEVYVLHYSSILVMVLYFIYAIFGLNFGVLQVSILLIVFSAVVYLNYKRLYLIKDV